MTQFVFILRCHNSHIRHATQISVVKYTVMSKAIITYKTGTVKAQAYVQVLHANIVHYAVISTLHKGRINCYHRIQACCCHTCCRSYCVLFRNTYVKEAFREFFAKGSQACTIRHSCGNGNDIFIFLSKFNHSIAKYFCISNGSIGISNLLAGCYFKRTSSVELVGAFFRRSVALALFSNYVYKHRFIKVFSSFQNFNQAMDIVTINGTKISKTKFFENTGRQH